MWREQCLRSGHACILDVDVSVEMFQATLTRVPGQGLLECSH